MATVPMDIKTMVTVRTYRWPFTSASRPMSVPPTGRIA